MKKNLLKIALGVSVMCILSTAPVYAAEWKKDNVGWWWQNDDGSYPVNCWQWLDGNKDGIAECYYFGARGYMLANTKTPDGFWVDHEGAWTENGVVQHKTVSVQNDIKTNTTNVSKKKYDDEDDWYDEDDWDEDDWEDDDDWDDDDDYYEEYLEILKKQQEQRAEEEQRREEERAKQKEKRELREYIDEQIEELRDQMTSRVNYTYAQYAKKVTEKSNSIVKIKQQLAAMENDTSQKAIARRKQLEAELAELEEELDELQTNHSLQSQIEALEDYYDDYCERHGL